METPQQEGASLGSWHFCVDVNNMRVQPWRFRSWEGPGWVTAGAKALRYPEREHTVRGTAVDRGRCCTREGGEVGGVTRLVRVGSDFFLTQA